MMRVSGAGWIGGVVLASWLASAGGAAARDREARPEAEPPPLPNGKRITPLGQQTGVGSFPCNVVLSPDRRFLAVTDSGAREFVSILGVADGKVVSRLASNDPRKDGSKNKSGLYYGLAWGVPRDGKTALYVSRGAEDRISIFELNDQGQLRDTGRSLEDPSGVPAFKSPHHIAGLAVSRDATRVYAVHNNTSPDSGMQGSLSILDTGSGRVLASTRLPGFPYAVTALTAGPQADRKVYVTSERDGVVSVLDAQSGRLLRNVTTGDHPVGLALNREQTRLFVANSGSDTVSILNTETDQVEDTVLLRPDGARGLPGATPLGMDLAPDGKRLYVTLADMNAVAVVDLPKPRLAGYLPVGWYPTAVVAAPDGKRLFVANAKGANPRNPNPRGADAGSIIGPRSDHEYILNILEGTVSTIDLPGKRQWKSLTEQVIRNNRILPGIEQAAALKNPGIKHVFYIIKENRTYDQVLGDVTTGNGEPKLCFFPREVTPNQHALAERFVLLDNFYCCAEVSADGWNWSTSGMANEYTVRNSPYGYTGRGRVYDYEGTNNGVAVDLKGLPDVARAPGGYLWDAVARGGLPFRNYGFFVSLSLNDAGVPTAQARADGNQATKKILLDKTDENFRQFDLSYADSNAWVLHDAPIPSQKKAYGRFGARSRFEEWKREFDQFVKDGNLPAFSMIRLPRDHTAGTSPGSHSPRAMVADNDFGVGQVVEAISHSPYWKSSAIFILQDDAQNGFDHVDAHRSPCYVISPFIKKSMVDHRFYNTDSVLRTMEALMGLPPMCQYDAVAPLMEFFSPAATNAEPYTALLPARSIIAEVNRKTAYRARESARLNFAKEDSVPDEVLNDILWHELMGRKTPKPSIRYSLGGRPRKDDD